MDKFYKGTDSVVYKNPILSKYPTGELVEITESDAYAQLAINNTPTYSDLSDATVALNHLYDAAIITLQNGFSDQEEKSFRDKQEIIAQYQALDGNGDALGVAGLSAENLAYVKALTGSSDNLVLVNKIDNMIKARSVSRLYSPQIEFQRNSHIDQLVEGVDNSAVVASLSAAYAALGG
jgi:hypothetical protein